MLLSLSSTQLGLEDSESAEFVRQLCSRIIAILNKLSLLFGVRQHENNTPQRPLRPFGSAPILSGDQLCHGWRFQAGQTSSTDYTTDQTGNFFGYPLFFSPPPPSSPRLRLATCDLPIKSLLRYIRFSLPDPLAPLGPETN